MNKKVFTILEYDKIISMLLERCSTPLGKAEAEHLEPSASLAEIETAQSETESGLNRLCRYGTISFSGAYDIRSSLFRLEKQASLNQLELLTIQKLLKTALRVKKYGDGDERTNDTDALTPYFENLDPLISYEKRLSSIILSEDEIADDASPKLLQIRRKIRISEDRIHTVLNDFLKSGSTFLQESVITLRNGRYCIPIKNEYRSSVPGMIHDQSASGNTVFIEPMRIVHLNNEIRELETEEKKEIEAILWDLSLEGAEYAYELRTDLEVLSHLDFVFAKASLAKDMHASRPVFNEHRHIDIKQGRHPLLDRKVCVPIDIYLGDAFNQLIITGPNTGGKTVSLKTVGLLSLMGQAGLHIPAAANSKLGIFRKIYADIGDEQSIEQNLSTFSSHMHNIITILKNADVDTLILLDELCAGTDPNEGAVLAIAILEHLHQKGIPVIATTHYSEIKLYALDTPGVENASCEFDVATLSPTYRLLIGIPGKSNAFAISKKLGLPSFLIENARQKLDSESEQFEDVLQSLDFSRKTLEKEREEISSLQREAKLLRDSLSSEEDKLNAKRDKILEKAKEEAAEILEKAKAQVDETIRAIQKSGGRDSVKALEKERTKTREMMNRVSERKAIQKKNSTTKSADLHIGDKVLVLSLDSEGTVSTLPDQKGNLFVQMGLFRSRVHVSNLQLLPEETLSFNSAKTKKFTPVSSIDRSKALHVSPEINLIGKTVDEALPELDKYLDDAYLCHLPRVRIVHGKGSGILRNAVQKKLKNTPFIKEYHLGEYGEGDAGVTIAVFK